MVFEWLDDGHVFPLEHEARLPPLQLLVKPAIEKDRPQRLDLILPPIRFAHIPINLGTMITHSSLQRSGISVVCVRYAESAYSRLSTGPRIRQRQSRSVSFFLPVLLEVPSEYLYRLKLASCDARVIEVCRLIPILQPCNVRRPQTPIARGLRNNFAQIARVHLGQRQRHGQLQQQPSSRMVAQVCLHLCSACSKAYRWRKLDGCAPFLLLSRHCRRQYILCREALQRTRVRHARRWF